LVSIFDFCFLLSHVPPSPPPRARQVRDVFFSSCFLFTLIAPRFHFMLETTRSFPPLSLLIFFSLESSSFFFQLSGPFRHVLVPPGQPKIHLPGRTAGSYSSMANRSPDTPSCPSKRINLFWPCQMVPFNRFCRKFLPTPPPKNLTNGVRPFRI